MKSRLNTELRVTGDAGWDGVKPDPRFRQLLALAEDGDEAAAGDLWLEFGFEFGKEVSGYVFG